MRALCRCALVALFVAGAACLAPSARAEDGAAVQTITFTGLEFAGSGGVIPIRPVQWTPPSERARRTGRAGRGTLSIQVRGNGKKLAERANSGVALPTLRLHANQGGGTQAMIIEIKQVMISSYQTNQSGDDEAIDSFDLGFDQIVFGQPGG